MPEQIRPAVESVGGHDGGRSSATEAFVHLVARQDVRLNVQRVRDESSILREMDEAGGIRIVGAMYGTNAGTVGFVE